MSFLNELKRQKDKLKETETVVTCADGQRYVERKKDNTFDKSVCNETTCGFVIDTKPDDVPAKVVDYLYIGSQDCTATDVLRKYEIKHVLSLGINVETKGVGYKFVECLDLPETNIKIILSECLTFINESIGLRENVLVHCNAGVSRTSMVAIGYLMQYHSMEFVDAYSVVKSKRPAIQPNVGFRKQLNAMKPGAILE